jgi:hypothetical protein
LFWSVRPVYLTILNDSCFGLAVRHCLFDYPHDDSLHLTSRSPSCFFLSSYFCLRAISCLPSCLCLRAILFSTLPSCFRLRIILFSIEGMGADVSFPYSFDIGSDINSRSGYCTFHSIHVSSFSPSSNVPFVLLVFALFFLPNQLPMVAVASRPTLVNAGTDESILLCPCYGFIYT